MSKDNVLNILEQSEEKSERFFQAWKRGVDFLGDHLFGPKTTAAALCKEDLTPLKEPIQIEFEQESCGEEQFLAAMVSFYDPAWGEELALLIDCDKSIAGLTYNLDHERTEILCELLRNYQGW
ncbi:MAG: hypothetical protein RQ754_15210 [Desulfuromonadales bacterium]|nr:hypothetical protein [Desulfuromonadales bacterium]